MKRIFAIVAIVAGIATLAVAAGAQQQAAPGQPPPFKTGVDALQLDVSVLDKDRHPVRGLTAADFTVLENGKPSRIVGFSAVELPPPPRAGVTAVESIAPDVSTNDQTDVGRIVVILMDYQLRESAASVVGRRTAERMVDGLGPADLGAVVHVLFGEPQNLTTDKARLKSALATSAAATIRPDNADDQRGDCMCGLCKVAAVTRIADALRGEPQRRKTVFFVGEQFPGYPKGDSCDVYLGPAIRQMLQAAHVANVAVHSVDPNGLEVTSVQASDNFAGENVSAAARVREQLNRSGLIERQQSLRTLADLTGGRAVMNTNAPEDTVRSILDESSAYYLLGVQVANRKPDGRFHPITVQVNRPGVQVRTRKGYYAESLARAVLPTAGNTSLEVISSGLLPTRALPMSVTAAPFRGPAGKAVVVVATGVTGRAAVSSAGKTESSSSALEPIEIRTSAFGDGNKNVEWHRQQFAAALPIEIPNELRYETVSTLTVAPGAYEVRVATRQERSGLVGSVHAYVDVPDFDSARLSLSGMVVFDKRAPTAAPADSLGGILERAPTTRREFRRFDNVSALARIYQKSGERPKATTVVFRVLDAQLREVSSMPMNVTAGEFDKTNSAEARFTLPLDTLEPGAYVLRLDASMDGANTRRDLRFSVK